MDAACKAHRPWLPAVPILRRAASAIHKAACSAIRVPPSVRKVGSNPEVQASPFLNPLRILQCPPNRAANPSNAANQKLLSVFGAQDIRVVSQQHAFWRFSNTIQG